VRCLSMQLSPFTHISFRTFPLQPYLPAPHSAMTEGCHGHGSRSAQASPFTRRLATDRYRIEFTYVWDCSFAAGCFPPRLTATQFPFASPPELGAKAFRFSLTGLYVFMITRVRWLDTALDRTPADHRKRKAITEPLRTPNPKREQVRALQGPTAGVPILQKQLDAIHYSSAPNPE